MSEKNLCQYTAKITNRPDLSGPGLVFIEMMGFGGSAIAEKIARHLAKKYDIAIEQVAITNYEFVKTIP